jgi:hypothetical protein
MLDSPTSTAIAHPTLRLQPQAEMAVYDVLIRWEAYASGEYQLSDVRKVVAVQVRRSGEGYALDFRTSPPQLTKPEDLESLEQMALRLASLYERVVVQAAPTGQFTGLLNHDELLQTWAQLSESYRAASLPDDEVTNTMLGFISRQLQSPSQFLLSLGNDYLYQALLPDLYEQPLGKPGAVRSRRFPNFFDKIPLCFAEQVVVPSQEASQLALEITGTLDTHQTNVAAVQAQIAQALSLVPSPAEPVGPVAEVPAPHFGYQATYVLSPATGLPISVDLTVYARAGQLFNKQYTLTLTRQ